MAKVVLVQMVYNGMKYIPQSFDSMVNQTFQDREIVAVINGSQDGSKDYIQSHYPAVRIIDPGENLKFVRGHNLVFNSIAAEFFQLVNQDLILEPDYVEKMLRAFEDPNVGAANGKIYQYDFDTHQPSNILDTTGLIFSRNGRGRSRGQNEIDQGQYDANLDIIGVDGAACMYRKSALEAIKYSRPDDAVEYFDLDFEMYWEDGDLSLRLNNAGFKCRYAPTAVGFHGRTASASKKGYKDVGEFRAHHKQLPAWIKQFNYKNHMFVVIKNFPKFYWKFFVREFFMLGFVLVFEISTLRILPTFFKQLPLMWKKRKWIQSHRKSQEWTKLLNDKGLLS